MAKKKNRFGKLSHEAARLVTKGAKASKAKAKPKSKAKPGKLTKAARKLVNQGAIRSALKRRGGPGKGEFGKIYIKPGR